MHHKMHARALLAALPLLVQAAACSSSNVGGEASGGSGSGSLPGGSGNSSGASSGGQISGGGGASGGTGNASANGGASTARGGSGQTTAGAASAGGPSEIVCPAPDVVPTPLRRLTRFEYANSVKALLNVDPAAANDLPADEASDGFSNNAGVLTVSSLHAEKYVLVSEALAKAAVANVGTLTGCDVAVKGEDVCQQTFARSFGRRAFRRPITEQDERMFKAAYDAGRTGGSYAEGIEVMVRAALQSPDFLYRLETTTPSDAKAKLVPLSGYEMATRLSFLIWATGPDDALLDAASRGELGTKAQVAEKVRSMLGDAKARVAITQFYNEWLGTSRLAITTKNTTLFPAFTAPLQEAMKRELPAFVEYVLWSSDHKLSTLLTSQNAFVSGPLAQVYGVASPAGAGSAPQMLALPAAQGRSGVLTQAGFLAVQSHPDQTSAVLRGKFVLSRLLCSPPPAPPPDVNVTPPEADKGTTARERLAGHEAAGASCANCHQLMDPIGLAFENFDALGQYRTTEGGKAIDVRGEIKGTSDASLSGTFNGVRELATKLAGSQQVRDCVATHWFRYASGRNEDNGDTCSLRTLRGTFGAFEADLVELIVATTQADTFWFRSPIAR